MRVITLTAITGSGEDMFDGFVDSQTETAEEIVKTFPITGFNSVTILNTSGVSASLEVDGTTQTVSLIRDSIKDWWDYWFAPTRTGRDTVFYFPVQASGDATLTISYPDGTAKCGMCVTGLATENSKTRWGVSVGITDYSIISTDEFGQTYLNPGNWAKRADADLTMPSSSADIAYREIVNLRATPCVFDYNQYSEDIESYHTPEDGIQALVVYGYTEDYSVDIIADIVTRAKHESQGLT